MANDGNGSGLTTQWLAARLGASPERVEARRRNGEILGVRKAGAQDYWYPAWQWDAACEPLPSVPRVIHAAREAGIRDDRLYELLTSRTGLTGSERLLDALRAGREQYVIDAVRAAAR